MNADHRFRVEAVLGSPVESTQPVHGGYTPAERWRATLADGRSAFVKIATNDHTRDALRSEHRAYRGLGVGRSFVPRLLGFDDHPVHPMLLLEDLSAARWPPPWQPGDLQRVRATLHALQQVDAPFPALDLDDMQGAWARIEADPLPFLALGVCTQGWLEAALPTLIAVSRRAPRGAVLLHQDVRSDNLCLIDDPPGRVVLVDWNHAGRGPAGLDLAFMAPSVRLEGGPLPDEHAADAGDHVAWVSGFFAERAGQPPIPDAPRVRRFQLRQLRIALPWTARVLGLPAPDGAEIRGALRDHDRALAEGRIDEATWHAAAEEDLIDAYLATADLRQGSGKSGDASAWRWSRELALDAVAGDRADVLDVGCANGLLMHSFEQWGAERGIAVTAHGLEISARMAAVARDRWPQLAARIHVGNVLTWVPPRRYDLVHTGLDYVPESRRRELVQRLRRAFLAPGGRVVLRAERVGGPEPDPVEQLRSLGFEVAGVAQATDPASGAVRRTAWISAPA